MRKRGKTTVRRFLSTLPAGTQLAPYAENRARIEFWINGTSDTLHVTPDQGSVATSLNYISTTSFYFPIMFDVELHGAIVNFAWYGAVAAGAFITVVETFYEEESIPEQ